MMQEIMKARRASNFPKALELLDVLILKYPDYSEGWNQRATIYYLMGNLEASLKDVAETLVREPRHFGALAGRAAIRWMRGETDLAKQSFNAAIEIHPYLSDQEFLSQ
jgi:tetratricopeptide (TPR) repeat protein